MTVLQAGSVSVIRKLQPIILFLALFSTSCRNSAPVKMLVISDTTKITQQWSDNVDSISASNDVEVVYTSQLDRIIEDSLANFNALLLVGFGMDTLSFVQQNDIQRFAEAGGGVLIASDAEDTIPNWPWLNKINEQRLQSDNKTSFHANDHNVYLLTLQNQNAGNDNLSPVLVKLADSKRPDYSRAKTLRVPENNRFEVEVLDTYLYEPMEMVVFNDGRVLFLERRGDIKLYDPKTKKTRVIDRFDVSITGNYEDGMLGVALDPDFEKNNYIYINYSPAGSVAKQNVSRFEMHGDSIIRSSEKIVLEIPTQRETCCHSGGHLTFGPNKDLYISTGDNTSSKESDGFSPIDERPGRAPFDAQKSSGNTHDLRGKILRIHPEPDGTYSIPDGNLFPKDGSKGRPEIFVMGTRNAFRFSVDPKTGYVYWGDVGPDGGVTTERGPQSYDEFNQAKQPGNYGWPYFVADNKAYADFDFATNTIGPKFNPDQPENTSPNNTGARILPPAKHPMIWYPYGISPEFPMLGTGSRSAMAGPVYYYDDFKNAKSRFSEYYDRKLFIYEWARSWVKVVSFDENWNLATIEPFLPDQEWYKPIDMKFGPDGSLYVLQYGANYFEHNPDSRLVRITYIEGNREPVAKIESNKSIGATPLTIKLSAKGSYDADKNDELKYSWDLSGSSEQKINNAEAEVTYNTAGTYRPKVLVTDREGRTARAELIVRAGNELPEVNILTNGANRSFYFDNKSLPYTVKVNDKEDGVLGQGISDSDVFVSFDYLSEGKDLALLESNAQLAGGIKHIRGKNVLENSDCKTCHNAKETSIGPSYSAIADRYKGKDVNDMLASKIINGGNGNWGKNMMAAHPQHSKEEALEMVRYIMAINEQVASLPSSGSVKFDRHKKNANGFYVMRASYSDKGAAGATSLTSSGMLVLKNAKVQGENMKFEKPLTARHIDGSDVTFVSDIGKNAIISLEDVDLTGIVSLKINMASLIEGTRLEVRTGSAAGNMIGEVSIPLTTINNPKFQTVSLPLSGSVGKQSLYFVFRSPDGTTEPFAGLDWIEFVSR